MHFASLDGGPCFIGAQGLSASLCEPLRKSTIFCYFCDLVLKTVKIVGPFLTEELTCKGKNCLPKDKEKS